MSKTACSLMLRKEKSEAVLEARRAELKFGLLFIPSSFLFFAFNAIWQIITEIHFKVVF